MYITNYVVFACYSCSGLWQLISQKIFIVQPQMFDVISCSDYISTGLEVVLGKVSINEIESLGV